MKCKLGTDGLCQNCGRVLKIPGGMSAGSVLRECLTKDSPKNCIHRGEVLRVERCKPCQSGGKSPEVYACAVHGECTLFSIAKRKPDGSRWQSCLSCGEREAESAWVCR